MTLPSGDNFTLARARVPRRLLPEDFEPRRLASDGLALVDLRIERGQIGRIEDGSPQPIAAPDICDLAGAQVWPPFVDVHTHLDKGHIWDRARNPDGTLDGAVAATRRDREARWSAGDVRRRFEFALRCAYAHGTAAMRTHLDCDPPQGEITWPVFAELREQWAGRIELQAVGKMPVEHYLTPGGEAFAQTIARHDGLLGGVTRVFAPAEKADAILEHALNALFDLARQYDRDVDLHVDETGDPASNTLAAVARAAVRHGWQGRVTCGHCCSLAMQDEDVVQRTLDLCADARLNVVTLPMVNLFLQARSPGATPRWRGITRVKELAARGIRVAVASDNCRDPFFAFGDHDMLEGFSQAVRIAQLDDALADWPAAVTLTPAAMMGFTEKGSIAVGLPADLVLFPGARTMSELLARPQADRIVLRRGRVIDATLPHYRELDAL